MIELSIGIQNDYTQVDGSAGLINRTVQFIVCVDTSTGEDIYS